jgi:hypothetical protein
MKSADWSLFLLFVENYRICNFGKALSFVMDKRHNCVGYDDILVIHKDLSSVVPEMWSCSQTKQFL